MPSILIRLFRRSDAKKRTAMRAGDSPAADDLVAGTEDVVHIEPEVGERAPVAEDHALEPLSAADEVGREELVKGRGVALIRCSFDEGTHVGDVRIR
jgi:hypothetical protein